jgi:hypothetical protein
MTFYHCQHCDEPFEQHARKGPRPKYCSPAHRQRAFELRRDERLYTVVLPASQSAR